MMKRMLSMLLALVLLCSCLSACGVAEVPAEPSDEQNFSIAPKAPEEPCNTLIEYDPDREIYFTCHNYDYDVYKGKDATPYIPFYVISKRPLDISTIEVQIPIDSGYKIAAADYEGDVTLEGGTGFPYYLYQRYMGVDWSEGSVADEYMLFEGTENAITVKEAYNRLTVEDLPQFYSYSVIVLFTEIREEAFGEMEITLEGETYRMDIGEIRLHPEMPFQYTPAGLGLNQTLGSGGIYYVGFYTDGLWYTQSLFNFTAQENLEILELEWLSPTIEVLDFEVITSAPGAEESVNFYWDGTSAIYVPKGATVSINVYIRDSRMDECVDYIGKISAVLNLEQEGERYSAESSVMLWRTPNRCEYYAIVFDGLDMEPYYRNRVQSLDMWRENYS